MLAFGTKEYGKTTTKFTEYNKIIIHSMITNNTDQPVSWCEGNSMLKIIFGKRKYSGTSFLRPSSTTGVFAIEMNIIVQ